MVYICNEHDTNDLLPEEMKMVFNTQTNKRIGDFIERALYDPKVKLAGNHDIDRVTKQMNRVYKRESILFCIDIEAWEQDRRNKKVTEIGIAIYDPRKQKMALAPNIETLHLVIKEREHLRNGRYVSDNKDNFIGMESHTVSLVNALKITQGLVDHYFNSYEAHQFPCSLVGHGLKNDVKWLREIGVSVPHCVRDLDTQMLYARSHGLNGASLTNCLRAVKQPFAYLHNAGNDAYYTLLLALKLCDPEVRLVSGFECSYENNAKTSPSKVKNLIKKFSSRE